MIGSRLTIPPALIGAVLASIAVARTPSLLAQGSGKKTAKLPAAIQQKLDTEGVASPSASEEFPDAAPADFAYPTPWLSEPGKDRLQYMNALRSILKGGWGTTPAAIAQARKQFDAACKFPSNDPRVHYAYALVLWKHGQRAEARQAIQQAVSADPPFVPALQAAAWTALIEGDPESASASLQLLGQVLATDADYPNAVQRENAARFLGRAVGFLEGPGKGQLPPEQLSRIRDEFLSNGDASAIAAYREGADQAERRYDELVKWADRPAEEIVSEFRTQWENAGDVATAMRMELKALDRDLAKLRGPQRLKMRELAREIAQIPPRIAVEEQKAAIANKASQELSVPKRYITTELVTTREQVPRTDVSGRTYYVTEPVTREVIKERPENPSEAAARLAQKSKADDALAKSLQTIDKLAERNKELLDEKKAAAEENSNRMKQLGMQRRDCLRRLRENLALQKALEEDFKSPGELKQRVYSVTAYVPWELADERDCLLESYAVAAD